MIIQLNQSLYRFRYLPRSRSKALSLFFQGGNVAYRRSAFESVGLFDEKLDHCEDVDAGIRLIQVGELFSNPNASVVHTARLSLRKIIDQWFHRGLFQVQLLRKHAGQGIEVFVRTSRRDPSEYLFHCIFGKETKFTAMIFLNSFLFLNIALWGCALSHGTLRTMFATMALIALAFYLRDDFTLKVASPGRRLLFAGVRAIINVVLFYATLLSGLRHGMLFLSFTR